MKFSNGRDTSCAPPFFLFSRDNRGVSEVVSVLLLTVLMASFAYLFLATSTSNVQSGTSGVVDVMQAAEHRQNQLLTVLFSQRKGDNLEVVLYAYGTEDVPITQFYLSGENTAPIYTDAENAGSYYNIPSQVMVTFGFSLRGLVPIFSWTYSDPDNDAQSNYEVWVGTTSGDNSLWCSGQVASSAAQAVYAGSSLSENVTYYVQVRTKDGYEWADWMTGTFRLVLQ